MTRLVWSLLWVTPFAATCACLFWILSASPFASPLVDRSLTEARLRIEAAMARQITDDWIITRLDTALAQEDLTQIEMLVDLAIHYNIAVPPALKQALQRQVDAQSGLFATTRACTLCAIDLTTCPSLGLLAACGITFELTPGGDLNAVRRGAVAYANGEPVDRLDLGLALVGLSATGAVVATGGGSYTLKVGASLLRVAKKMGTLTPALTRRLTTLMRDAVRWDELDSVVRGGTDAADLIDTAKLTELGVLGRALGQVRDNTSLADTLLLMRHVDSPADAARLARASDSLGTQTRPAFAVLGKSGVFRAMVRLSDLALGAVAAMYAAALQLLIFCAQQGGNFGLRAARRAVGRRRHAS